MISVFFQVFRRADAHNVESEVGTCIDLTLFAAKPGESVFNAVFRGRKFRSVILSSSGSVVRVTDIVPVFNVSIASAMSYDEVSLEHDTSIDMMIAVVNL